MPSYRIHRLKDHLRQQFRFAPHMSGTATLKAKDYAPGDTIDASSPYAAFFQMKEAGTPLEVGDLLESEGGSLRVFKYVGFEEAQWMVVEDKREMSADAVSPALQ
jgi:hypothetical protein